MMCHFVDGFLNTIQNVTERGGVEGTIGQLFHFRLDVTFLQKRFKILLKSNKRPQIKISRIINTIVINSFILITNMFKSNITLFKQLEELEGKMRYLDSRAQNYDDISRKAAENEDTLKLKYADLARRHNETLQKYSSMQAENRSLREQSNQSTPVKEKVIKSKVHVNKKVGN